MDMGAFYPSTVMIRNDNPDKGTETYSYYLLRAVSSMIRNDNPDKGTETNMCLIASKSISID